MYELNTAVLDQVLAELREESIKLARFSKEVKSANGRVKHLQNTVMNLLSKVSERNEAGSRGGVVDNGDK